MAHETDGRRKQQGEDAHIERPRAERRSGFDRRSGVDRRGVLRWDPRAVERERRSGKDRRDRQTRQ